MTNNLSSDQFPTSVSLNFQLAPTSGNGNGLSTPQAFQAEQGPTDQISTQKLQQGLLISAEIEALSVMAYSSDSGNAGALGGSPMGSTLSQESLIPYLPGQQTTNNLSLGNSSFDNTAGLLNSDSGMNNDGRIITDLLMALMLADSAPSNNQAGNGSQMNCGSQADSASDNGNLKQDLQKLENDISQLLNSSDSDGGSSNIGLGSAIGNRGPGPAVTQKSINADNFDIKSYGDPHITSSFNGGPTSKEDKMTDTSNLATFFTKDGNTTISTTESDPDSKGITYNKTVGINHQSPGLNDDGSGVWNLTATDDNGKMTAVIKSGQGEGKTTTLADGQSVTEGDGTTIENKDGKITVQQKTAEGGDLTETISENGKGLDVEAKGTKSTVTGEATDLYYKKQVTQSDQG